MRSSFLGKEWKPPQSLTPPGWSVEPNIDAVRLSISPGTTTSPNICPQTELFARKNGRSISFKEGNYGTFSSKILFFRNIDKITCPLFGETDTFLIGYFTLVIIPCGICRPTHMIMYCGAKTALQYESDIRRNYLESFPVSPLRFS